MLLGSTAAKAASRCELSGFDQRAYGNSICLQGRSFPDSGVRIGSQCAEQDCIGLVGRIRPLYGRQPNALYVTPEVVPTEWGHWTEKCKLF